MLADLRRRSSKRSRFTRSAFFSHSRRSSRRRSPRPAGPPAPRRRRRPARPTRRGARALSFPAAGARRTAPRGRWPTRPESGACCSRDFAAVSMSSNLDPCRARNGRENSWACVSPWCWSPCFAEGSPNVDALWMTLTGDRRQATGDRRQIPGATATCMPLPTPPLSRHTLGDEGAHYLKIHLLRSEITIINVLLIQYFQCNPESPIL